jgi:membrane-bound lytic murein transglycosylase D
MKLFLPFILFVFFQFNIENTAAQDSSSARPFSITDTSLFKKDTSNSLISTNDLKSGFKDLFTASSRQTGISSPQLNPRALNFVQDYMERQGKKLTEMKGWGRPYFDMMDIILTQHGIPRELKYLAVIESHLKSYAVSWAGAVGPWQFMPGTARQMGLTVNRYYDERTNYYKSTHAAARYLTQLYLLYQDWLLVIAAYNGGPGNVDAAIRKSKSRDFWSLQHYLPTESKNHVKKFIATHYIMEGQAGLTTLTKDEAYTLNLNNIVINPGGLTDEELNASDTVTITGRYNSVILSKHIVMDIISFNRYNPEIDKTLAAGNKYALKLPADKMILFNAKKAEILNESMMLLMNSVGEPKKAF